MNDKGAISEASPKISPVSHIIDPTAFPSARPGSPCIAESTETAASGVVVPILTIVAPITAFPNPHCVESVTASSTSQSAPLLSVKSEIMTIVNSSSR